MPSLHTVTRASNCSATSTNFALARACRPFSLTILSVRSAILYWPVKTINVLAPCFLRDLHSVTDALAARLGQFDEHG